MPLKLKGALARLGIRQAEWAASIKQDGRGVDGKPLSLSAATQIMNWNTWPRLTSQDNIKRQTEELLRRHGVDEVDIAHVWEVDKDDLSRNAHPLSVHVGQTHPRIQPEFDPLETEMLSANAKKLFGIFRDPFDNDVQGPDDVFLTPDSRYIREAMLSAAKHGGFLAVIGEPGAGKSVLRKDLIDRIARDSHPIVMIQPKVIDKMKLTSAHILEAIVRDLNPDAKMKQSQEGNARMAETLLRDSGRAGNSHVLLIEEAHDLSTATLKLLKRFWELEDGFKRLLSIIMVAQPEMKIKLNENTNPSAREVIRRCEVAELPALDKHLEEYLAMKFKRVGKDSTDVFAADAYDAIRKRLTERRLGVYPLNVHNLVTKALNLAAEIGSVKIGADDIKAL